MLKVQVSPFLGISEWVDPHSGITFSKKAGFIEIPDGTDLTNIKKYIRLNQLIFVGGTMSETPKVEAPVVETPKEPEPVEVPEPIIEEPKIEEPEEVKEVVLEEPVEAPKPKKKTTPKKKAE